MPKDIKELNSMQRRVFLSKRPHIAILGGYGSGKSWGTLYKIKSLMVAQPGSLWMVGRSTLKDLKGDTYEICFGDNGIFGVDGKDYGKFNRVDNEYHMKNGSKIFFAHFDDPKTLRGPSLTGVFIEQAEMVKKEVFDTLTSRLRQWGSLKKGTQGYNYIEKYKNSPIHIHVPQHYFYIIANPGGHNWLKEEFLDKKNELWEVIETTTYDNEKNLPIDYIENLKKQHNELWIQKYIYGSFEKAEGIVYPEFTDDHIIDPIDVKTNEKIYLSIDPGYRHASVAILATIRDENLIIFDEVYEKESTISEVCKVIRATLIKHFSAILYKNVDLTVLIDPSANRKEMGTGISIKQQYVEGGFFPIDADNEAKSARMVIKDLLKAKKILVTSNCLNTIREFGIYKWHPTKADEVVKTDDDTMDAIRYIVNYQPDWKKTDVIGENLNQIEDRIEATNKYIAMIFKEETEEKEEDSGWGLH